jgi:endonuclease YncB( thermonuclease family)
MLDALLTWWRQRSRKARLALVATIVLVLPFLIGSMSGPGESGGEVKAATEAERVTRPRPRVQTFVVSHVADGDTIRLANGQRVRLVQIDAPELGQGECYAGRSRAQLEELVEAGEGRVRLEFDPRLDQVDRYGRQLAYVFVGRTNVNLAMVRRGGASVWFFDGRRGKYAGRLLLAARQARAAARGLWGSCKATQFDPLSAVVARKPPPPPPPPPPVSEPAPPAPASNCHPSYEGACLDPSASDYDCEGGSGNGPFYTGYVTVVGPDDYGLDADGDGQGCED